ncbi:RHS repeat domain-containing protein, partial [uncultured Sphingomonas sp.]|uniref:RHS repeat domain-containing protein n=1 Tax=uncultured Sphingomonas sp. TaxID=158754 RepID=UPI0035CB90F7
MTQRVDRQTAHRPTLKQSRFNFHYDNRHGHVLSSRDLGGRVTDYGYDPAGRLARTTGPETVD